MAVDGEVHSGVQAVSAVPGALRNSGLDVGHGVHRPRRAVCEGRPQQTSRRDKNTQG